MTLEQRDQYLPVMKALLNVMEQKKPAPEDINTLLMLTRDLLKKIPEGQSLPSLGFGAGFGGFGLEGIKNNLNIPYAHHYNPLLIINRSRI